MKKKRPALRFSGFDNDWEQRKLEDVAVRESKVRRSLAEFPSVEYEDVVAEEGRLNKEIRKKKTNKNGIVFDGTQILYGKLRPYLHNWLNPDFCGVAVGDWWVLKSIMIEKGFLYRLIQTQKFDDIANQSSGSKMPRADWNLVAKSEFMFPKSREEQAKIGVYFSSLDHLITLHQCKCKKLICIKKSMLENMFPQKGEKIPRIRFSGFTDDWEQRKVADIASDTRGGGTPTTSNRAYWDGEIPWIQSSDLSDGKVFGVEPRKHISRAGLNNSATQLVPEASIAIVTRVGVGKLAFMPYSYTTSQDFLSLCRLQTEPYFSVYSLYQMLQGELQAVQGTSIKGMTKDDLLSKSIIVPKDKDEQQQIGLYFRSIDNLITLHQRKLEKLQNIKKAMLEKMFV